MALTIRLKLNKKSACPLAKSLQGVKTIGFSARDQRAFRCGFTRARRGTEWKKHPRSASVSGTAAVVAFRLRSSRLSTYTSLFRSPNR
jgi:hypothetical protein